MDIFPKNLLIDYLGSYNNLKNEIPYNMIYYFLIFFFST